MKTEHPSSSLGSRVIHSACRMRRLATLALGLGLLAASQLASAATITVDASKRLSANPHFWSAAFGTGKAMLALRPDWQTHNKIGNRELGAQRVRGHGLFNTGEMDLWKSAGQYDWKNLDTYLLAITSANMRPIIELDFMPKALSTTGNQTSPPKDYAEWKAFIKAFTQHLVDKYTMEDVSKWYFEVWNEPDYPGFWDNSDMSAYYTLYDNTVDALTSVIPNVLVGGPAATNAGPIGAFLQHCKSANKRVTFASSHCYPGGPSTGTIADAAGLVSDNDSRISGITGAGYSTADVKSFNTEWNSSYSGQGVGSGDAVVSMDNHWNVGFILKASKLLSDKTEANTAALDVFSYWVLSDVFDEDGGTDGIHMTQTPNTPFGTIFGIMTFQGMRKAAFNAFKLLDYTGPNRVQSAGGTASDGIDAMATISDAGDSLQILAYNYYKTLNTASGSGDSQAISVTNLPSALAGKEVYVTQYVVDENHSNPYSVWVTQGKPANPSEDQWRQMHAAQHLSVTTSKKTLTDATFSTTVTMLKQSGLLLIISAKRPLMGRNSLVEIEGEDYDGQSGATKEASGDDTLGQSISVTANGYVYFENVDYTDDGVDTAQLRVKTASDTSVELHAETQDGKLLAKCSVTSTSSAWATQTCALSVPVTGVAKLYAVFGGAAHLNWLKFKGASNPGSGGSGAGGSAAGGSSGSSAGGSSGSSAGGANGGAGGRGGAAGNGAGGAAGGAAGKASGGAAGNGNGGASTSNSSSGGAAGNGKGGDSRGGAGGAAGNGNGGSGSGGVSGAGGSTTTRGGSSGCSCHLGEKGKPSSVLMIVGALAAVLGWRRSQARRRAAARD
jgi:xylan 1,4-beta-xylosidase